MYFQLAHILLKSGDVLANLLATSVVDRGFELRSPVGSNQTLWNWYLLLLR